MIGYLIILVALTFIIIVICILRRAIKRRNYRFLVTREQCHETYMNWICGRN